MKPTRSTSNSRGFTLIELTLVVAILATLALLAIGRFGSYARDAQTTLAWENLRAIRGALVGDDAQSGLVADLEGVAGYTLVNPLAGRPEYDQLGLELHLLFSPTNRIRGLNLASWKAAGFSITDAAGAERNRQLDRGWKGPYLHTPLLRFSPTNGFALVDGWSARSERPSFIELQLPTTAACREKFPTSWWPVTETKPDYAFARRRWQYARLVSPGPNGRIETPASDLFAGLRPDGSAPARGDDLVLFLNRADVYEDLKKAVAP